MPKKKQPTYEELKQKLDETVARLSDEKLTLSEMMKLYDEGNRYASECQNILESYRNMLEDKDSDNLEEDAGSDPESLIDRDGAAEED